MDAVISNQNIYQPKSLALQSIKKIRQSIVSGCIDKWLKIAHFLHMMCYFLQCVGREELQIEAAWICANIAAGPHEHTQLIVDRGIIKLLMNLFASSSDELVQQALWTLGNIVGDNPKCRDLAINHNFINHLLAFKMASISFSRTMVWVIMNLVRFKDSQISLEIVTSIMPRINELIAMNDSTIMIDALWALTFIAECNEKYIQIIVESGAIAHIVPLLHSHSFLTVFAAMKVLENVATGTNKQIDVLLANDILIYIAHPLMHFKENLRRMALGCLAKLANSTHVQAVFNSGYIGIIVEEISEIETRKEALCAIRNLIANGSADQVLLIINAGAVNPLVKLMTQNDEQITMTAIQSLKALFIKSPQLVKSHADLYLRVIQMP